MSGESSTPQAAAGSSEAPAASTSAGVAAVHAAIPPSDGVTPMELDDATNRATADASAAALLPLPAEAASAAPSAGDFPQLDEDEPMAPADFLAADSQARSQTKAATSSSQHAAAANASIAGVSTLAAPSPSSGAAVASSSSSSPPDPSSLVPAAFSRLVHSALSSLQRSEQSARIAVERAHEVQEHTWALLQGRKVECGCMSESVPVTMIASAPGHTPKHETKQQEHFHPTVSTLPKPPAAAVALDTLVETIEGCVAISALQAYLVASSSESMWTISVQLRNIATHTLDGLKISLAPSRTVGGARVQPFSLLAFTSSISLPSGESICLSARFPSGGNLPHAMREVPIGVQVTWREARKWTKLHTVTRLLLPRWGSTGQHRLLLSASLRGKVHAEEFRTPMISILDQLHRIALILTPSPPHSTRKATPSNEEESKENEPMTDGAGGLDLVRTLQEQCGFSSTATVAPMDGSHLAASNAAVMLRWLHHSRQAELSSSNRSNRFEDYLVRTTKQSGEEAIQVHVTSKHTMTAYGSSPEALLRFHATLSPHLLSPGFVAQVDLSSSQAEVQAKAQRESLQRGIEAQIKAMKQYLPSVTTAAGATTAAVGSRQVMMYVKQQLQAHMDMPDAGQALH